MWCCWVIYSVQRLSLLCLGNQGGLGCCTVRVKCEHHGVSSSAKRVILCVQWLTSCCYCVLAFERDWTFVEQIHHCRY